MFVRVSRALRNVAFAAAAPKRGPPAPQPREQKIDNLGRSYGSGGRKSASARVWIKPGDGTVVINGRPHTEYFTRITHRSQVILPFMTTQTLTKFDVWCTVQGGGLSGQAGAIRHGIANALQAYEPLYRPRLKKALLLRRDMRKVERSKVGLVKARKAPQWVKR
jgi:small subunit ribosomal protein S9